MQLIGVSLLVVHLMKHKTIDKDLFPTQCFIVDNVLEEEYIDK